MTVFRSYDIPEGRLASSFTYKIENLWDGSPVDELYTDSRDDAHRLIGAGLDQAYDVRLTGHGDERMFIEDTYKHAEVVRED